jgi:hypothetical protein
MLSDAELDLVYVAADRGFMDVEIFSKVIAQAKLANQLQAQLAKARSDALEEAAKICETTIEILYSMYGDGLEVESSARECAHAIREAKGKP